VAAENGAFFDEFIHTDPTLGIVRARQRGEVAESVVVV
jgi:hypothetical protein